MFKKEHTALFVFFLVAIIIFSACRIYRLKPKWDTLARGYVITPADEDHLGVIKVGNSHENECLVFYEICENRSLSYQDTVYFQLSEVNGLPLAIKFVEKPMELSDIYGGEIITKVAQHTLNAHNRPINEDNGFSGIPIHTRIHLVKGREITPPIQDSLRYEWEFHSPSGGSNWLMLGTSEFWNEFKDEVNEEVYVVYNIQNHTLYKKDSLRIIEDLDFEHNH